MLLGVYNPKYVNYGGAYVAFDTNYKVA
ncbi:15251af6-0f8f-49f2-bc15-cc0174e68297 [Thermothielavioides terrestris]|uniref:15251af6-0f8f-49f2-bc15-cc0174e68297 n=1 Tax=Thermothielavioides terrestris TaxID=2587410 RepID=A0A446BUL4_9PEZI|nr:15251af6-0f8f-49f2-bc15-cc0174e68297 [Thermothielavioides terrestris]